MYLHQHLKMGLELAIGNHLDLVMITGELKRTYPIEIESNAGSIATEFILEGGLGYTPLTIHGLVRHDGWVLQVYDDMEWQTIDQSVHGNDFWQTRYDETRGLYSLTWNIHNRGRNRYRVIWQP